MWWWAIALALHHQAPESLPVEPHPCSHLCQGDLCLPSLATGNSTLHVPAPTHQIVAIIVYTVVAQHCQLLILGCDIAHACFLYVSCMIVTGLYARRKQSGLTQSQESIAIILFSQHHAPHDQHLIANALPPCAYTKS